MGYTHYWKRKKEISEDKYKKIIKDFKRLIPEFENIGIILANGYGRDKPVINEQRIWINGKSNCGHPKYDYHIAWPSEDAGGINLKDNTSQDTWFAGAQLSQRSCGGDCSHETFYFPKVYEPADWEKPENGLFFECCKTAFKPYDLVITTCLIIIKYYLGNNIVVSTDGEDQHWFDAKLICQTELGYGMEYKINDGGRLEKFKIKNY